MESEKPMFARFMIDGLFEAAAVAADDLDAFQFEHGIVGRRRDRRLRRRGHRRRAEAGVACGVSASMVTVVSLM